VPSGKNYVEADRREHAIEGFGDAVSLYEGRCRAGKFESLGGHQALPQVTATYS
jgi:hypothetical protein